MRPQPVKACLLVIFDPGVGSGDDGTWGTPWPWVSWMSGLWTVLLLSLFSEQSTLAFLPSLHPIPDAKAKHRCWEKGGRRCSRRAAAQDRQDRVDPIDKPMSIRSNKLRKRKRKQALRFPSQLCCNTCPFPRTPASLFGRTASTGSRRASGRQRQRQAECR